MTVIDARQQQRYDTAANWATVNPLLLAGELGVESDTNKVKIGDGNSLWNSLLYVEVEPISINDIADVNISSTPSEGTTLIYNSNTNEWVPGPVIGYLDPSTDTYYDDVTLLLKFNGVAGTSNFNDSSSFNTPLTIQGTPIHSTTQVKYGYTSGFFNNTIATAQGLRVLAANNQGFPFGSAGLTIDTWVYVEATSSTNMQFFYSIPFSIYFVKSTSTTYYPVVTWSYSGSAPSASLSPPTAFRNSIPVNTWVYLSACKDSTSVRVYINGVKIAEDTANGSLPIYSSSPPIMYLGTSTTTNTVTSVGFKGYIDDFRITKAVARYTTDFTPPLVEVPSSSVTSPTLIYSIKEHSDVNITGIPSNGQTLVWDGATSQFILGDITGKKITNTAAPTSATDTGSTGEIRYDSSYVYVCTATNTWVRSPLNTW